MRAHGAGNKTNKINRFVDSFRFLSVQTKLSFVQLLNFIEPSTNMFKVSRPVRNLLLLYTKISKSMLINLIPNQYLNCSSIELLYFMNYI